ncbi:MAG: DUF1501 domain-containing protein [Bdellovibrionales bacterium]|nr:DUF1501 domain-containing protein [Bdellovibrionales bacterium]
MGSSRRKFLKDSASLFGGAVASQMLLPSFTFAQGGPSFVKNLIYIDLPGGPDSRFVYHGIEGAAHDALYARRPNLALTPSSILVPTNFDQGSRENTVGFHPRWQTLMTQVNDLSKGANVALICEAGNPGGHSRSHEIAQSQLRNGSTLDTAQVSAGWMGRLASTYSLPGMAVWSFGVNDPKFSSVDSQDRPFVVTSLTDVSFNDRNFGSFDCQNIFQGDQHHPCWTSDRFSDSSDDSAFMRDTMRRLQDSSVDQPHLGQVLANTHESMFRAVPLATQMRTQFSVSNAVFDSTTNNDNSANSLARSSADIVRSLLYLNLSDSSPSSVRSGTKVFATQYGGWDTHGGQAYNQGQDGTLPNNIRVLSDAIAGMVYYLDLYGLLDSTIIFASGEFGRTNAQNGSVGTDHAEGGHFLVVGGSAVVRRGVFGPEPSVAQAESANFFSAQVPWTGILRRILERGFDPSGLDSVFANPMPGSVPDFLV